MANHLMYINDITPRSIPGWRAKVKVQEKPVAKLVGKQDIKLQKMVFMDSKPTDAVLKEISKETPTKEYLLNIQTAENHYTTPSSMRYSVYEATSSETLSMKLEGIHNDEKLSSSLQGHQAKRLILVGQSSKGKQKPDSCKETMTKEEIQGTPPPYVDICNSSQDTVQP